MTNFTELGLTELRNGISRGDFTAVEVADAHNTAVEAADALNAFIVKTPEHALAAAKAVDDARAAAASRY